MTIEDDLLEEYFPNDAFNVSAPFTSPYMFFECAVCFAPIRVERLWDHIGYHVAGNEKVRRA